MSFWDDVSGAVGLGLGGVPGAITAGISGGNPLNPLGNALGIGSGDPNNQFRGALGGNAQQQGGFGQTLQNQYMQNQADMANTMGMLQGAANGQNSVAQEQLRQGMQAQQAQQMSMAAGASPQNAAMAARTAANNMARAGYGMSGQAAMEGLQERQGAMNALAQMQMQQSGQNLQGALGFGGLSNSAYGTNLQNPQQGWGPIVGGLISGGAAAAGKFA